MSASELQDRANHVLRVLVDRYIQDGQPIGSKTIAQQGSIGFSSATIRSIMSDLEDAGFLCSPHTSAGRIPTAKGYRFFVNQLMKTHASSELDFHAFAAQVNGVTASKDLAETASGIVSTLTHLAGIVTVPKRASHILRHIEFLPLNGARVLVILVFNEQEVQNRVMQTDREYSQSELQEAANFMLAHYRGKSLDHIRSEIIRMMQEEQQSMSDWMQQAMQMAHAALEEDRDEDYIMTGQANLLGVGDDIASMRGLFEAFAQKRTILHLLDQCLHAEGVQIFIGEESGVEALGGYSVVTRPYQQDGQTLGVLGVIGPTRMDYQKAIGAVDVTAKLISAALHDI